MSRTDSLVRYFGPGASPAAPPMAAGAPSTHADLLGSVAAASTSLALKAGDVVLSTTPLHTAAGFSAGCLAPLLGGAKLVRPCKGAFDAGAVLSLVTQQRPNKILLASPAQANALTAALKADAGKSYDVSSVAAGAVLTGGSASMGELSLKAL